MPHRAEATGSVTAGHQLPTPGPGPTPTEPDSGFFDPSTGAPIPTSQIGNFSFVKDAQGVFRSVTIATDSLNNQFYEFNVADPGLLRDLGFLPKAGGAAPSFASSQAGLQQQFTNDQALLAQRHENELAQLNAQLASASGINAANIQAQIDLENLRHENDLAEMALQFESQLKQTTLGEIGATTRTLIQEKGQERARQTELAGRDIFKFTANLRGRAAGTAPTPVDIFKQQGAEFINRPLPQVDPNAPLSELQAGLSALQKLEAPQGQGIFGLAHGGVIQMEQGADGTFSQKRAFFVGENPDGTINDTTEILITGGGRTEVIPISGGAQGGLDVPNLGGFPDLLDFLRRSTGLNTGLGGALPAASTSSILTRGDAAKLGARQRGLGSVVRDPRTGGIFIVTPQGLRHVGSPEAAGLLEPSFGQFTNLNPLDFSRLSGGVGFGSQLNTEEARNFQIQRPEGPLPEFQAFGQPLNTLQGFLELARVNPDFSEVDARNMADRIGFLPAPAKIARQIGIGGANLDDQEIQGLLSLYGLANVDLNTFFRQIEAATPQGRLGRPQRIGFTGARL